MNLGSVSIELKLERGKFDQEINSLSKIKIRPIDVRLNLDTKDFERQVKGLTGFIPSISIPVELDTRKIQPQAAYLPI
jgi:hypothetical protein